MQTLENKTVVVTGAGSGIGRALALTYGAMGAKVVVADIEDEAREETVALLGAEGVESIGVPVDVADAESVEALARLTEEQLGGADVVCLNAGVGGGGLIKNQELVDWKWVIDVNLWGVVHGIHSFLPQLMARDEAHIMATASVAGLTSPPGLGPYNATKHAVVAIMETLFHEMSSDPDSNVGVSVLCPGVVNTNIITAQRNRPEHLARSKKSGSGGEDARRRNANIAKALAERGMDPAEVARHVVDASLERRFWVLSHPEHLDEIRHRNESLHTMTNPTLLVDFTDGS